MPLAGESSLLLTMAHYISHRNRSLVTSLHARIQALQVGQIIAAPVILYSCRLALLDSLANIRQSTRLVKTASAHSKPLILLNRMLTLMQ